MQYICYTTLNTMHIRTDVRMYVCTDVCMHVYVSEQHVCPCLC